MSVEPSVKGAVAQLVERLVDTQRVGGSIPSCLGLLANHQGPLRLHKPANNYPPFS